MHSILMSTLFYKALVLQGEIWCWPLLGLKGLNKDWLCRWFTFLSYSGRDWPEWHETFGMVLKRIAPYKSIQDSLGFWIPSRGFWILCQWNLDSGVESLVKFLELDSGFQSPGFQIPEAKLCHIPVFTSNIFWIPESVFPYVGRNVATRLTWPKIKSRFCFSFSDDRLKRFRERKQRRIRVENQVCTDTFWIVIYVFKMHAEITDHAVFDCPCNGYQPITRCARNSIGRV